MLIGKISYFVLDVLEGGVRCNYEEIDQGDTRRFSSYIFYVTEDFEVGKSLKGFASNPPFSNFTAILLNLGPVARDIRNNRIQEFQPEVLLTDRSNVH